MQRHGRETLLLQVIGQSIALHLGAGKHNGLVDIAVAQPMVEQQALVLWSVRPEQHLLDVAVFFLRVVNLNTFDGRTVVVHDAHGQLLNTRRKGGAEHHGLAALFGQVVDIGQIIRETQIQHAVGFVHHQKLHLAQVDLPRTLKVQQTARCGHHEVGVLQFGNLQLVRHTAHHIGNPQTTAMFNQVNAIVRDLLCQLSGGAQH